MKNKVLECVDVLKEDGCITTMYQAKALETIRQALTTKSKKEQAFDIIKEKYVDTYRIRVLDFELFNQLQISCRLPKLTQEEFDILKEML